MGGEAKTFASGLILRVLTLPQPIEDTSSEAAKVLPPHSPPTTQPLLAALKEFRERRRTHATCAQRVR